MTDLKKRRQGNIEEKHELSLPQKPKFRTSYIFLHISLTHSLVQLHPVFLGARLKAPFLSRFLEYIKMYLSGGFCLHD